MLKILGRIIYFVIADLSLINCMYQFSLNYFLKLFKTVIINTAKIEEIKEKVRKIEYNITDYIYNNICQGLFNDHKKILSFLLTA